MLGLSFPFCHLMINYSDFMTRYSVVYILVTFEYMLYRADATLAICYL